MKRVQKILFQKLFESKCHKQPTAAINYKFLRVEADARVGLTGGQVRERREAGAVNSLPNGITPTYKWIFYHNIFTLFNCINLALALLVVFVGHANNALFFGVAVINTCMGVIQEIRAKRTLDRLSVLSECTVDVVRDGKKTRIPQNEIVPDDIMLLSPGGQICADATVVSSSGFEVNESLLTGESDNVVKSPGQPLLSGSYAAAGVACARVTAVGAESYANMLAAEAKKEKKPKTPMMRTINRIIRVLTLVIIPIGILLFVKNWQAGVPEAVLGSAAAMIGMIPEGLVLLTGVAMTAGALRIARASALVQTLPGIEMLARTDVICLDKTGTITDGTMALDEIVASPGYSQEYVKAALRETLGALPTKNAVSDALQAALSEAGGGREVGDWSETFELNEIGDRFEADDGSDINVRSGTGDGNGQEWRAVTIVPFSSERKWSGVCFEGKGWFVIGAPGFVLPGDSRVPWGEVESLAGRGKRVLCLAHANLQDDITHTNKNTTLNETAQMGGAVLPSGLEYAALITLSDTLRQDAAETFGFFAGEGVQIKVISGDDPLTVSHIASQAGIDGAERYIDMSKIVDNYIQLAEDYTVFGRVSPRQKKELVAALKSNGHTVCMTGDGVNDVLAMKEADCSVAMRSGADAARGVSDFVLMESDFAAMKQILYEGRRVINNIETVSALYLIKTMYSAALSLLYLFMAAPFPFAPLQVTPINMFTVGIPTFFLTLRRNFAKPEDRFVFNIVRFALPAAAAIVCNILLIHLLGGMMSLTPNEMGMMRIVLTAASGFFALFLISRPTGKRIALFFLYVALFSASVMLFRPYLLVALPDPFGAALLVSLLLLVPVLFGLVRALTAGVMYLFRE